MNYIPSRTLPKKTTRRGRSKSKPKKDKTLISATNSSENKSNEKIKDIPSEVEDKRRHQNLKTRRHLRLKKKKIPKVEDKKIPEVEDKRLPRKAPEVEDKKT